MSKFQNLVKLVTVLTIALALIHFSNGDSVINKKLKKKLAEFGVANIFVTIVHSPQIIYDEMNLRIFETRAAKALELIRNLKEHAQITQKPIHELLNFHGINNFKSFWISNRIYIPKCLSTIVNILQSHETISEIREEVQFSIGPIKAMNLPSDDTTTTGIVSWGLTAIEAPIAWTLGKGTNGSGVIVGSIDTGVLWTHVDLETNYLGVWLDPEDNTTQPTDEVGHGTHTLGTFVGQNGIGVAPGAKWLACKGCARGLCAEANLLTCGQFMTCPDGESNGCKKIPHVVSNSWGGEGWHTFYQETITAWLAVNIIPVFANGNTGPNCGTTATPGGYSNVISVGATEIDSKLAKFSSRSLSKTTIEGFPIENYKPNVAAPGVDIRSAWFTGDTAYNTISGTSMATPHVAGLIALIISAYPKIQDYMTLKSILLDGCTQSGLQIPDTICENVNLTNDSLKFPNNEYGMGIINAKRSVSQALQYSLID